MIWPASLLFVGRLCRKAAPYMVRYWREVLIGLMALFIWHLQAKVAACRAFKAEVKTATKQATIAQQAVNHVPAAKSQAIAEKSDAQAPAYYASVRAAADRVRVNSPRCTVAASVPRADNPPALNDGPADPTRVVPEADYNQLVDAAARAAQMHADAEALIAAGVAKSE